MPEKADLAVKSSGFPSSRSPRAGKGMYFDYAIKVPHIQGGRSSVAIHQKWLSYQYCDTRTLSIKDTIPPLNKCNSGPTEHRHSTIQNPPAKKAHNYIYLGGGIVTPRLNCNFS
jgi:hypothetical protein